MASGREATYQIVPYRIGDSIASRAIFELRKSSSNIPFFAKSNELSVHSKLTISNNSSNPTGETHLYCIYSFLCQI